MVKIKAADATDITLDWLVCKAEGKLGDITQAKNWVALSRARHGLAFTHGPAYSPSTDPAQAWPIIEREHIDLHWDEEWYAKHPAIRPRGRSYRRGSTSLIAAMRCYVVSRLGDEVEVPEDLLA